jgi:hypothetical protein
MKRKKISRAKYIDCPKAKKEIKREECKKCENKCDIAD